MREIDFDKISKDDLIDHAALSEEFKKYLRQVLNYTKDEAKFVADSDFENPYDSPFIEQSSVCSCIIDGKNYDVRLCYTDFRLCGIFYYTDKPPFEFYMFVDVEDITDGTVGSYSRARKLYFL